MLIFIWCCHRDNHSIREPGKLGEDSSVCFSHCWFSSGCSCSSRAPAGCWRSSFPKWWRSCWPPCGIRCCVRLSPSWHARSWWRSSSSTLTTGPRWRRWPPPTTTEPSRSSPRDAREEPPEALTTAHHYTNIQKLVRLTTRGHGHTTTHASILW